MKRAVVWVVVLSACQMGTVATSRQYACDSSEHCASGSLCWDGLCVTREQYFSLSRDSGVTDAGEADAGFDGGATDSGVGDSGSGDSGVTDSGVPDSGVADAGVADAGCDAGLGLELCSDGLDNNCNGLVDCAELGCAMMPCGLDGRVCTGMACTCGGGGAPEAMELTCNDARDNDCDSQIDCADMTCGGRACGANGRTCFGTSCTCSGNGGTAQATETSCSDGRDNDCDGLVDAADPNCPMVPDAGAGDGGVTYGVGTSTQPFVDACALTGSTRYMFADPDDDSTPLLTMPFAFSFYGVPVTQYWVGTNGNIVFSTSRTGVNDTACMPTTSMPRPAVFVAFNDIVTTNGLCVGLMGTSPNRKVVVTWPSMDHFSFPGANMTFSAFLSETTNAVDLAFSTMTGDGGSRGVDAITAVQNAAGDRYTQYQCHVAGYLTTGLAIRFTPQ